MKQEPFTACPPAHHVPNLSGYHLPLNQSTSRTYAKVSTTIHSVNLSLTSSKIIDLAVDPASKRHANIKSASVESHDDHEKRATDSLPPVLDLPWEIRREIWKLTQPDRIIVDKDSCSFIAVIEEGAVLIEEQKGDLLRDLISCSPLLLVNHQISEECRTTHQTSLDFLFWNHEDLFQCLAEMTRKQLGLVRSYKFYTITLAANYHAQKNLLSCLSAYYEKIDFLHYPNDNYPNWGDTLALVDRVRAVPENEDGAYPTTKEFLPTYERRVT